MKDRLVELIDNACKDANLHDKTRRVNEQVADYLLANGVIVPPCKVGDIVYFVARNNGKPIGTIDEIEIVMIGKTDTGFCAKGKLGENTFDIIPHFEIDNYTFFASREEAQAKLKEGVK